MLAWLVEPAGYLGWMLLVAVISTAIAAFAVLVRPVLHHPSVVVVAPVLWTGLDVWRSVFPLGGFEWGALGYAHVDGSWLLPLARIAGLHAVTFVVVMIGAAAFDLLRRAAGPAPPPRAGAVPPRLARTQPALLVLTGVLVGSSLATIEPPAETGETVDVLAAQGSDVAAAGLAGRAADVAVASNLLAATQAAVDRGGRPDLTVWPESSIDRDPTSAGAADLAPLLREAASAVDGNLLVGVVLDGPDPATTRWTSSLLLDRDAVPVERYDKRRPVPFGEYVPARDLLDWFPPLRQIPRDTLAGEGPQAITVDGHRIATLICFETLFPSLARDNVLAGGEPAALLVASTNDATFGRSAEPSQHLAQSRMRAVETGRWVVHAAQSGSSAFVDPYGRVHDATSLFAVATIRRDVPLVEGLTPFLVTGDVVGVVAQWLVVGWVVVLLLRRRRRWPTARRDRGGRQGRR